MNRQQRRAALKQQKSAGSTQPPPATAAELFMQALRHQHHNQLDDAVRVYKRLLAQAPDHAEAWNNYGVVLLAQGKPKEAAFPFQRSLMLLPQLLDDFGSIAALLVRVNAALGEAMQRADTAWPNRLPLEELLGSADIAKLSDDILLRHVLRSTTVRNVALERLLTSLRAAALRAAGNEDGKADNKPNDNLVEFYCSLARQCFINEYVFAAKPEELAQVEHLKEAIGNAMASGSPVVPVWLSAVAMYRPLHALADAQSLLNRDWQKPVAELLTQQVREPQEERQLRASIPRLTPIDNEVSLKVQQQYEENPYPRWDYTAVAEEIYSFDDYISLRFPNTSFRPLGKTDRLDILVAGCGTGRHSIEVAQRYKNAHVVAVDLSLTSLSYAKRKTPPATAGRIEYAQADILKLPSIAQTFDIIDASGVLHHMSDPFGTWRALLSPLRPGGFMHLGLYSKTARRQVVATRNFIA